MLSESEVVTSRGWDNTVDGQRRKRGGHTPFWGHADQPKGMAFFRNPTKYGSHSINGDDALVSINGTTVSVIRGDGVEDSITQPAAAVGMSESLTYMAVECMMPEDGTNPPSGNLNIALAWCNAYEHHTNVSLASELFGTVKAVNGSWFTRHSGGLSYMPKPRAMAWVGERLWVGNDQGLNTAASGNVLGANDANITILSGSDLRPSKLYRALEFDHPYLSIWPGIGGSITAIFPLRTSSAPAMIVGKEHAIAYFSPRWASASGQIAASKEDQVDTVNSVSRILSSSIGIVCQRSMAEVHTAEGTDIWFLASDGHIRSLKRVEQDVEGGAGSAISWDVPDTMARVNMLHARESTAAVHGDRYYISLPMDSSASPSHTLVFDTTRRTLVSIEPRGYRTLATGRDFQQGQDQLKLWAQHHTSSTDCSFTGAFAGYHIFKAFDPESYIDPNGTDITAIEDTIAFHLGALNRKKRWAKASVMFESATNATATFELLSSVDGGSFSSLGTVGVDQGLTTRELTEKKFNLEDLDPGFTIQFRLKSSDAARISVIYLECAGRPIQEEFDNDIG